MYTLRFLLTICGLLSLPSVVSAQFTRSGNYWVPNSMVAPLPTQARQYYYPNTFQANKGVRSH